jgi:NTP pyrophosphatase (non-canonical NTP hydrolase)
MTLEELQSTAWKINEEKGFHEGRAGDGRDDTLVRLCLIHSEVTEAVQEVKRHGTGAGPTDPHRERIAEELADILIRTADLAACLGVSLTRHVRAKLEINAARPRRHNTAPHAVGC